MNAEGKRDALRALSPPRWPEGMPGPVRCWWCWREGCDGECPHPVMIPRWRLIRIWRNERALRRMEQQLGLGIDSLRQAEATERGDLPD